MALCTGTPRWRIDQLITGQALPAWDEAQLLAWHFKMPLSQLIRPIQREFASRGQSAEIRAWTTPCGNASRTMSLQTLAAVHPNVFDATLAEWPAQLAPNLAECLATEVEILRINEELLKDCLDAVRAPKSLDQCPDHSIQSIGDALRSAQNGVLGVESRIQALSIRHALRISAPHPIDVHDLALGLNDAIAALNNTASELHHLAAVSIRHQR